MKVMNKNTKKYVFVYAMLAWPILHWLVFTLYMNIQTVYYSFIKYNLYMGTSRFANIENYTSAFNKIFNNTEEYGIAFRNTILFLGLNVLVIIPLALLIAYVLSKDIPFSNLYSTIFFFPNLISIVVLCLSWSFMWDPNRGVVNSVLKAIGLGALQRVWLGDNSTALINIFLFCIWSGLGMSVLILGSSIKNISKEIYESAELDGITRKKEYTHIVVPMIWPTVSTLVILSTAGSFSIFLQSKILTNGQYGTMTIAFKTIGSVFSGDYGQASSLGILIGIFGFVMVSIVKKFIDRIDRRWN